MTYTQSIVIDLAENVENQISLTTENENNSSPIENENNSASDSVTEVGKGKKLKSKAWDHFERKEVGGKRKVVCLYQCFQKRKHEARRVVSDSRGVYFKALKAIAFSANIILINYIYKSYKNITNCHLSYKL